MANLLKFLKYVGCVLVGGFMILFFGTGISAAIDSTNARINVVFFFAVFSILGLLFAYIAKRKGNINPTLKLWLYTTFIPVISWIDILVTPSKTKKNEGAVIYSKSHLKEYQIKWELWEMEHSKPEQMKRIKKALQDCSLVRIIDEKESIAVVKGERGGEYTTSLSMCSCPDFAKRHKPCKHMYFLAKYLGVFNPLDF